MFDPQKIIEDNHNNVFFFSKEQCPYCDKLERDLISHSIPFNKYTYDPSHELYQDNVKVLKEVTGMNTFPMLYFGAKRIGGYSDFNTLAISNMLPQALEPIGIKIDTEF
jgi:glutaredoxin